MNLHQEILEFAASKVTFSTNNLLDHFHKKYTRAYVLRFVKDLILQKKLVKSGSTRSAKYALTQNRHSLSDQTIKKYILKGLKEHEVLEELKSKLLFLSEVPEHLQSIFAYAFSEMLNNAIDHSQSKNVSISVEKEGKTIRFVVDDSGIGVFKNIMEKRKLKSQLEAIQDLMKGKVTTMPQAHSGEGIFFTSKVADLFILESDQHQLRIDNLIDDIFVKELNPKKNGTRVIFEISTDHKGHLDDVFRQYYSDAENFAFDKTEVHIKLYTKGSIYVSRSQAKRVLSGLEKFKTIILDFDQVPTIGQAFVDEIFRVFQSQHPHIKIIPKNMNEAVNFMIARVEKP